MIFKDWLNTFIDESDLDRDHVFEIEHGGAVHTMEFEVLVGSIIALPAEYQKKIKGKIVSIDKHSGEVMHYLNHVAEGFVKYKVEK